jgi:hypothetical protein
MPNSGAAHFIGAPYPGIESDTEIARRAEVAAGID